MNSLTDLINDQRPMIISSRLSFEFSPILNLTFNDLIDFFSLNLDSSDKICMFESSLNIGSAFNLMSKLKNNQISQPIFAHWENCGYSLRKKLRMYFELPDFMPMMLEFTRENWFILSTSSYKTPNFKKVTIAVN